MKVITCISDVENPGYVYGLKASCKYFGLDLITIKSNDYNWKSQRNKDLELKSLLTNVDSNEIILFSDGYDTIFIANEDQILKKYEQAVGNKKILISAEKTCYPDSSLAQYFQDNISKYKYVNSGGIIGSAKSILCAIEKIEIIIKNNEANVNNFPFSNQHLWSLCYLQNRDTIELDTNCTLFQTLMPEIEAIWKLKDMEEDMTKRKKFASREFRKVNKNFEIGPEFIFKNIETNQYPIHLHFNSHISKFGMFQKPYLKWMEHFESNNGFSKVK